MHNTPEALLYLSKPITSLFLNKVLYNPFLINNRVISKENDILGTSSLSIRYLGLIVHKEVDIANKMLEIENQLVG